jgi:hypothetical protein
VARIKVKAESQKAKEIVYSHLHPTFGLSSDQKFFNSAPHLSPRGGRRSHERTPRMMRPRMNIRKGKKFFCRARGMQAGGRSGGPAGNDIHSNFSFNAALFNLVAIMPQIPDSHPSNLRM